MKLMKKIFKDYLKKIVLIKIIYFIDESFFFLIQYVIFSKRITTKSLRNI